MKKGIAGSLESSDCRITVVESDKLEIQIKSVVGVFFHEQIERVVRDTLKEKKSVHVSVLVEDKGALDQTIKARLVTALDRMVADQG